MMKRNDDVFDHLCGKKTVMDEFEALYLKRNQTTNSNNKLSKQQIRALLILTNYKHHCCLRNDLLFYYAPFKN